ncbi:unnamed protein product [Rotaria sordida]|uniref:Ty3 transposon capsid-like protein domain-containing protein n=1 Tax=Rotaria sordida TaxID=392033 RepID=A0A819UJ84_9BILA|nr:unnamed protein product [Rotaria sordida]CAF1423017.1 unnamed protein product [Rotaria sordida]CAF4089532.1 unnamed protein product [Rotaria sordida]CAF4139602.1 unnamed protein product [Rotaria sordida]
MNNDDRISHLNNSSSYKPTNIQNISYLSTSISKNKQDSNLSNPLNKNRRKSIIPSSHLPTKLYKLPEMDNESDHSSHQNFSLEETEHQFKLNTNLTTTSQTNNNTDNNDILSNDMVENTTDGETNEGENNFEVFILKNFTLFSGEQDVNIWLDATVDKFDRSLITTNLRLAAIPLLVKGQAHKVYLKNKRNIQSFDDFTELLLSYFDKNDIQLTVNTSQETFSSNSNLTHQIKSSEEKTLQTINTFDNTHFSEKPPKHHSTQLNEPSAAAVRGESLVLQSTLNCTDTRSNTNTSNSDDTTNVVRKALLQNLIKNPKTFQGGKDDVMKWLDDIEHLFDVAHISDPNKLDLISYSLRGEALRWFQNTKDTLTSWEIFVSELKRTFTSSYHAELAFKKLEVYTQAENQSIRNFYNEVIKLCKEADPAMSESAKLRYLLNKTKPTIQFEVRRKKPTTTKEFLEHAKEIEDLYQLSNLSTNTQPKTTINPNTNTSLTTLPSTMMPSMVNNYSNSFSSMSQPRKWNKFDNKYRTNYNKHNFRSSYTVPSYNSSFQPRRFSFPSTKSSIPSRTPHSFAPQRDRTNQQKTFHHYTNKQTNTQQRSTPSSHMTPRQNNVNSLITLDASTQPTFQPLPVPTDNCTRCNQFGHQAIACPNF